MEKIGFGGSCHWCTEAVFQALTGVREVLQGWISPENDPTSFSEAVIVHFDQDRISLETLIQIHLHTHSCTSEHSMREKYRSAVYVFDAEQIDHVSELIAAQQEDFTEPIITQSLLAAAFKLNSAQYLNYYFTDPSKPFCENIVNPKLQALMKRFGNEVDRDKLSHLSDAAE